MNNENSQRRYDLDWLRVLAILAIFVFHCTRMFDTDDWSIKNGTTYLFMDVWNSFATIWGMPLILLISGASAFYALGKVRPWKYVKGLFVRLFVPLVLGIFTHVAFQVYLENLNKGIFSGSFLEFYPHYFDGMYGFGGNFAWMGLHLWYLELLFLLSLLCLPLFYWLKMSSPGRRVLKALGDLLALPGAVYLLAVPVTWLILKLDEATWGNRDLGGWSVLVYPCFFISSFVIVSHARLQERIQHIRWLSLGLGIVLSAGYLFLEFQTRYPAFRPLGGKLDDVLLSVCVWGWLLAVIGFGMQHLQTSTPFLKYANEAALPFYILHQTVIVCLAYWVVQLALPDWLKFGLVLSAAFLLTAGLYHWGVRRSNLLRFLFGMKLVVRTAADQPQIQVGVPARTL
jgi:glucan biosynthesis protein C